MRLLMSLAACQRKSAILFKSPLKKVSGIRLEVPGKAVRLNDMGMRTCRIPARIVDLWPATFLIDVPSILVQLGKGTDV